MPDLQNRVAWCFVAGGIVVSLLALLLPTASARSFVFDAIALIAATGAIYGIARNEPGRRGVWQLVAVSLLLFAAGDVVFDVAQRGFGQADGFPYSDVLYLLAYPVLAIALARLARSRYDRETAIDSIMVAIALSAVIWQWVVTPVLDSTSGASAERIVSVAYPIMDILLVVVIVHAVFTLPRWTPAAWLLFAGLGAMLVADVVYARLVADGTYTDGGALDVLWPISYFLLAAAVMHPSMRALWEAGDAGLVRHGRARMVVLGAALFAAPAVVILDDSGSSAAVVLAVITGVAAIGVAWRITRLVDETNQARVVLSESEARFRVLVQHATDIIVVISKSGRVKYISPAVDHVFGRPSDDLVGRSFARYLDPAGVDQSHALYEALQSHPDEPLDTEFHVFDGEGWRWVEATWTNQLHEPAVAGIVGNLRDITDRKRSGAFAQAQTRVLELVLSGAPVPETLTVILEAVEDYVPDGAGSIRLYDPDEGTLVCVAAPSLPDDYVRAVGELTTLEEVEAAFRETGLRVTSDIEHDGARPAVAELCVAHGLRGLWSMPIRTPDGSDFLGVFSFFLRTVREPEPEQLAVLERARDLVAVAIDRDARTKELGHLALHDTLTGLPNRALVQDRLEHALARLADGDDDAMVAVLFVDLDRFKLVNDGLGHETGDELLARGEPPPQHERPPPGHRRPLRRRRVRGAVRRPQRRAPGGRARRARRARVRRAVRALHAPRWRCRRASASPSPAAPANAPSTLLQDADAAMYRAKRRGGARHELFDEAMRTQAVSRLLTERALRRALRAATSCGCCSSPSSTSPPAAGSRSRRCCAGTTRCGAWSCPATSSRVAEETGIIVPIGEWVLERACDVLRSPAADGPTATSRLVGRRPTSPPASCSGPTSRTSCARALQRLRASTRTALCLEIAESALLDDLDATGDALRALKELGVRLAIDDFGTGCSSLTYLRRFPFDELKIDRMFVEGLGRERGRRRDRRRHHRHGARARHDRGRRGRRDRGATAAPPSSSAATAHRATTSVRPRSSRRARLVLVEQRPA